MKPTPEIQAQIDKVLAEQRRADALGRLAAAVPLPGPTRDVFALQPEIQVGRWTVRPFLDIDFEFLSMLEHPLYKMMLQGMAKTEVPGADADWIPRGQTAWDLVWIMTRSADEVEALFKAQGLPGIQAASRAEFGRLPLLGVVELAQAVIRQLTTYWSPMLEYGSEEGEKSSNPPTSSEKPSTDLDGSSKSAAG